MAAQEDSFNGNVFFLGVARASIDRSLLAEYQYQGHIDSVAVAQMLRVFSDALVPGQGYSFSAGDCSWSLKEDDGALLILCTSDSYPQRYALQCLEEFGAEVPQNARDKISIAKPGQLTKPCLKMMKRLALKYDNLENVSKFHQITASVDAVKLSMEQNIRDALSHTARMEDIQDQSDVLKEQSNIFRSSANSLKKKMWCKNIKMQCFVFWFVVIILVVIALIVAAQVGAFDKKK